MEWRARLVDLTTRGDTVEAELRLGSKKNQKHSFQVSLKISQEFPKISQRSPKSTQGCPKIAQMVPNRPNLFTLKKEEVKKSLTMFGFAQNLEETRQGEKQTAKKSSRVWC